MPITKELTPLASSFKELADRGINANTAQVYGAGLIGDGVHVYPYFDQSGKHTANKKRYKDKNFSVEHNGQWGQVKLFGQEAFPAGGKYLTVTEGECDAMAAYELMGSKYPVVSVTSASEATKNFATNTMYLDSFEHIVINFDSDEAGQTAARACAAMFKPGKCKILCLKDAKDANDYLRKGGYEKYKREWWDAPAYTPQGLKLGSSMWDEILSPDNYETITYPWAGVQEKTYGLRLSEFVVVNAMTGVGKTTLMKEIAYHILHNTERGLGLLMLEEPNKDTGLGLMSISASKPLHRPDVRVSITEDDLRAYYDDTLNTDRVVIYDHFGSNRIDEILSKIRHMHNLGCKYIILDHLSIIVSDQNGDERKQLDEISTRMKTLCMELNICVIAVIHQNRQGEIRGTAGVEQLANIVIKLTRDLEAAKEFERNVVKVTIQKNRFCGRTGPAAYLHYNDETGRLRELTKDEVLAMQDGGTVEVW
jgi:twinkle protein